MRHVVSPFFGTCLRSVNVSYVLPARLLDRVVNLFVNMSVPGRQGGDFLTLFVIVLGARKRPFNVVCYCSGSQEEASARAIPRIVHQVVPSRIPTRLGTAPR